VISLRAKLDERRRTEDRISNTVLAAFAAGATVLVVVNIVALVFAQQSYQRDKDALQTVLVQEARALDQEGFENWSSALARNEQELRDYVNQHVTPIETRLGLIDTRLNQIGAMSLTASDTASLLLAQQVEDSGDAAEAEGAHAWAAEQYSRAAALHATSSRKYWGTFLISKIIPSLARIEPADEVSDRALDEIVNNLRTVDAAPPPDEQASTRVRLATSMVQTIREAREQHDDEGLGLPATSPPTK
jgi:hypothetical protein